MCDSFRFPRSAQIGLAQCSRNKDMMVWFFMTAPMESIFNQHSLGRPRSWSEWAQGEVWVIDSDVGTVRQLPGSVPVKYLRDVKVTRPWGHLALVTRHRHIDLSWHCTRRRWKVRSITGALNLAPKQTSQQWLWWWYWELWMRLTPKEMKMNIPAHSAARKSV